MSFTLLLRLPALAAAQQPIVYTLRVPDPASHVATVEAVVPTDRKATVELMMPIWSPGFYRVEDYASRVQELTARSSDGRTLVVDKTASNKWTVATGGAPRIVVAYRVLCDQRSVTTNWIGPEYGVLNGAPTFITLAEKGRRPHEVRLELPSGWPRALTALDTAGDRQPNHFVAPDYETLVDSPIIAGNVEVHAFDAGGAQHFVASVGEHGAWDGVRAATDLAKLVEEVRRFWGGLPYRRYVFEVVFRQGGGGLEHKNSTLVTSNPRAGTPDGYRGWLGFIGHEYFHAFNVKRLRPIELGPFDWDNAPRTPSLWISEGMTTYYADLMLVRAGLWSREDFLSSLSGEIANLQNSPGRLLQSVEQSSLDVWNNSMSGVNPGAGTVSYYVKGAVLGFVLDARVRRASGGRRSLDDAMRLAYRRYAGPRGFRPEEFRAVATEAAGTDLGDWFRASVSSPGELDYGEALEWFGLRFTDSGGGRGNWKLEVHDDANAEQQRHLLEWLKTPR